MSASLAHDDRLADGLAATVAGFPLRCRARTIGALIALDPVPSGQTRAFLPDVMTACVSSRAASTSDSGRPPRCPTWRRRPKN